MNTLVSPHPLRIGLVGYGMAGRTIHARLLREAGLSVRAVVVRDPERVRQAEADWPGIEVYDGLRAMLERAGRLDLVVVASPSGLHEEHAREVIEARTPLVLDKPLGVDAAAARRVIDAAAAAEVPLTVFQNRRWDAEQRTLQSLLAAGELGRVHRFERRWERWRPVPKDRWKENDPVGGGLLLDLGTHLVDSAVQCFGPVESVYAELRALSTATEDDVFLSLHHRPPGEVDEPPADQPAGPDAEPGEARAEAEPPAPASQREWSVPTGVVSHLWAGSLVGAPGPRTRVLGSRGAYLVTSFEGEPTPFAVLDEQAPAGTEGWLVHGDQREAVTAAPGAHVDFYRRVVAWLTVGGPVPVDPLDAWRTAVVLDCARRSAETGQRVPVPEP